VLQNGGGDSHKGEMFREVCEYMSKIGFERSPSVVLDLKTLQVVVY